MYESGCLTSFLLPPLRPFLINKEKARALTLFFFLANPILHTWPSFFFFCLINFCTALSDGSHIQAARRSLLSLRRVIAAQPDLTDHYTPLLFLFFALPPPHGILPHLLCQTPSGIRISQHHGPDLFPQPFAVYFFSFTFLFFLLGATGSSIFIFSYYDGSRTVYVFFSISFQHACTCKTTHTHTCFII